MFLDLGTNVAVANAGIRCHRITPGICWPKLRTSSGDKGRAVAMVRAEVRCLWNAVAALHHVHSPCRMEAAHSSDAFGSYFWQERVHA